MAVAPSVLGRVSEIFEENFRERGELGASISVWWNGIELLSEGSGWCEKERERPWTSETMVPVYSATKGPAAATLLLVLEEAGMGPENLVREIWPKFPVADASFGHLLSHQCGLPALDRKVSVWDHAEVVAAIEEQIPAWELGEGQGYHPRTFGALLEEPVRRLTGMNLGSCWRKKIAEPLNLDFWIGLPEEQFIRVAKLYPGKAAKSDLEEGFYREFNREGTLTRRAFMSPRGLNSVQEMNEPNAWQAGIPSMGGIGTASALAKFYQAAIGAIESPLSAPVSAALATTQIAGEDQVLLRPTVFTCGCQQDPMDKEGRKLRQLYGANSSAFGHPGAGGSHGFGDPETGISFGYVMNQMELSVMPGRKCVDLIDALYE